MLSISVVGITKGDILRYSCLHRIFDAPPVPLNPLLLLLLFHGINGQREMRGQKRRVHKVADTERIRKVREEKIKQGPSETFGSSSTDEDQLWGTPSEQRPAEYDHQASTNRPFKLHFESYLSPKPFTRIFKKLGN